MSTEPLDLRELDIALAALVDGTGGHSVEELLFEGGRIVQSAWRDNISAEGLVDTGAYLESIAVEPLDRDDKHVRIQIGTDVRNADGVPYPAVLEYGDSEITPKPVGMRAFDSSRRRVVKTVADGIERKVKSRARR